LLILPREILFLAEFLVDTLFKESSWSCGRSSFNFFYDTLEELSFVAESLIV